MHDILNIINEIETSETISFDESFHLTQVCSQCILNDDIDGYKLIINILNNWYKIPPSTIGLWTDLIESAGFYPYLYKKQKQLKLESTISQIRMGLHLSENIPNKYFHDEQYNVLQLLHTNKNVILSAPTSFGKSLLIEEIIASQKYRNIVIIQPTLALLDETRKKLSKYNEYYKIIVRTSQEPDLNKKNIYLFTAERVCEYTYFFNIDFLIIDEFYKLSGTRDDERASALNNAFHYILKRYNPKFYLLGPNIDDISHGFEKKFNAIFYQTKYSLVDSKIINIYNNYTGQFGVSGKKKSFKEKILFELLAGDLANQQTIIYCSSPQRVRNLSKKFAHFLQENKYPKSTIKYSISPWIKNNINKEWSVIDNFTYDIGIHDGALPKHVTTSIIDYFNRGELKYLFCTSTIIEGVNTSAENVIYFDYNKGLSSEGKAKPCDFFDYSNIKGRAGRMMEHYIGKIYNFNPPPSYEKIIVDIPFYQQNPIKNEVLIQLDDSEVINKRTEQYKYISRLPEKERVLIKNNGARVIGQKNIIDKIRQEIDIKYELIAWDNYPTYEQLTYILNIAWEYLIMPGETIKPMTVKRLVKITFDYGYNKSLSSLIKSDFNYKKTLDKYKNETDINIWDDSICEIFSIKKHWFEYKIPKWLSVVNEIQKFICSEKGLKAGNYSFYANQIENNFIRENLTILAEYGIPDSAIKKIEHKIPSNLNQDDVLSYIKQNKLYNEKTLIEYEKQKIIDNI